MAEAKFRAPRAEEIWAQDDPPDEMVWAVCPYLRGHLDDSKCKQCHKMENHPRHGECQRGCYGMAAEACRIVFAMQGRVAKSAA